MGDCIRDSCRHDLFLLLICRRRDERRLSEKVERVVIGTIKERLIGPSGGLKTNKFISKSILGSKYQEAL